MTYLRYPMKTTARRGLSALWIVVATVLFASFVGCRNDTTASNDTSQPNDTTESRVVTHEIDRFNHVIGQVAYETRPPVGGDHFDFWQNCFFYTEPVKDEVAVHSLEHGAVWVAYRSDVDTAVLDGVKARVESETHLLASPYPGLESPFVLSAWERQLAVDSWDDPMVENFLNDHLGRRSSTAPEAGLSCSDAVGTPDDPNFNYEQLLQYAINLRTPNTTHP